MGEPGWQNTIRRFLDTVYHEIGGLVALNLLFVATCLPVVTLGPAMAALTRTAGELAAGRGSHMARTYWTYFRVRLPVTLICGLVTGALAGAFLISLWIYGNLAGGSAVFWPLVSLSLFGLLALVGVSTHWLPELTRSEAGALALLQKAVRQTVERLPGTLAAALLILGLLCGQILFFPATVPLLLTVGLSVPALIGAFAHLGEEPA